MIADQSALLWLQAAYVTVTTKDIADDGETYTYEELMCPLSTKKEMFWDPTDTTSKLQVYKEVNPSGYSKRDWNTATNQSQAFTGNTDIINNRPTTAGYGAILYDCYDCPWMKNEVVVNEMLLRNLNQVDNRHRAVKNGFILCTTENDIGTYTINAKTDLDGTLYAYIGKNPVSNWKDDDFAGKSIRMNSTTKDYELQYEYKNEQDLGCPLWICFLPTDKSKIGTLKINSVNFESAE